MLGGGWRDTDFRYTYLNDIGRYVSTCIKSNNDILGTVIYNNKNTTIDFIFKANNSYGYNNSTYNYVFSIGSQRGSTTYGTQTCYLSSNINIEKNFIEFSQQNGDAAFTKYNINVRDDIYHHYACTIENNSLFKAYLDGKKILQYSRSISSPTTLAVYTRIYIFNYRISKGLRWTEDFVGQTPLDDVRWTIKESNDNIYGVTKKKG